MPIMDNFGTQFMKNANIKEHGLMSDYDKIKLDNIKLEDIEYIQNGLNEINEYMIPQFIYGIKIDPTNSDPNKSVIYTDDAVGFIPLSVNQTTGICNYGSWKDIINNVLGIQPCLVKEDGTILAYLNPDNYNQTIEGNTVDIESGLYGQVMIKFNHIYYRFSMDGNKIWFQISNKQTDSSWIDLAFASEDGIGTIRKQMFIGAYESALVNNKLQSISNKLPEVNMTFDNVENSSSFGVFNMMNIIRKQFIIFLGYLITKSIDLEGNIGNGNINGNMIKTGNMNTKGLFYGKSTTNEGVKLFGIENLWGNTLEYMHGIVQKMVFVINNDLGYTQEEQHIFIKNSYPYNDIDDFTDLGTITPNTSGFISSIKFLSESVYIPDKLQGSSSTYFKSYYENGKSLYTNIKLYGVYSGNNTYDSKAGAEFLLLGYPTNATTHIIY